MDLFLIGATAMASAVAGLLFLKMWRQSRDRLYVMFACSFWLETIARAAYVPPRGYAGLFPDVKADDEHDPARANYEREVRYTDDLLADFLDTLEARGVAGHTIVAVTSDHGEEFKEHGGLSHGGRLHEELLRVPLIVRWPAGIAPGRVLSRPVQSVDVFPTLAALAGFEPPADLAGRDISARLLGPETPPPPEPGDVVFAQGAPDGSSGCTIILPPPGNVASLDIRGSSPGSRELAPLDLERQRTELHGLLFTGGSAFGLAAADGVMRWLEEHDVGFKTPIATIPIVPAAVIFDAAAGTPGSRPGADAGYAACEAAGETAATGSVGCGAGATAGVAPKRLGFMLFDCASSRVTMPRVTRFVSAMSMVCMPSFWLTCMVPGI